MIPELAAKLLYNRGTRMNDAQRPQEGQRALLASLACAPYTVPSWLNLGNALLAEGDAHAALGAYRRAMTLNPSDPRGAVNAGIALLTLGQWDEGWDLYEARFAMPEFSERNGLKGGDIAKMWDGSSLRGKTLLVFNEQGVGDTIMSLRYGQSLFTRHRAKHVIYRVPPSLYRLVKANVVRESVVTDTERMPAHDVIAPFMSLHGRCASRRGGAAYLRTEEPEAAEHPFRVGLVWAGSPHHTGDKRRSLSVSTLAPIFSTQGAAFVSLQAGKRADEINGYDVARVDIGDYYDTARIIKGLDLVITVDTSVAHLAGALGVPTWIMLASNADFRWMQHRTDTPWYDSVRLYRQTTAGDWSSVIERIRYDLATLVNSRSAV